MDNETVREIQYYLRTLSFRDNRLFPVTIDGIYGKHTEEAVETFQRFYGLPTSGDVDFNTWNALVENTAALNKPIIKADIFLHPDVTLFPGTENELVSFLQVMLNSLAKIFGNLSTVSVNGVYDEATEKQIRILQELHGFDMTGIVDVQLWNRIAALFNAYIKNNKAQTG